jgi:hypothetical protein
MAAGHCDYRAVWGLGCRAGSRRRLVLALPPERKLAAGCSRQSSVQTRLFIVSIGV